MELQESQTASPVEDCQGKIRVVPNHWTGRKHRPETIAKLSAARQKIVGWKHSDETKRKIGAAHIGMKRSAETRANISAARAGKPLTDRQVAQLASVHRANTGATRTKAARQRITAGKIARWAQVPIDQRRAHMAPAVAASRHARPSSLELAASALLDELGIAYVSEHRIGPYTVDLFVSSLNLVIECDGEYWHRNTVERDAKRDRHLTALGYRIMRLPEAQIRNGAFRDVLTKAVL